MNCLFFAHFPLLADLDLPLLADLVFSFFDDFALLECGLEADGDEVGDEVLHESGTSTAVMFRHSDSALQQLNKLVWISLPIPDPAFSQAVTALQEEMMLSIPP